MTTTHSDQLAGKTALITGASKGLGAGMAEVFARAGANVVVNYASSRAGAEAVVDRIHATGGRAVAIHGDVTDESAVDSLYDGARDAFGTLDVLVNNAGILRRSALEESTPQTFHDVFNINVLGIMLSTKRFAAQAPGDASIINISAIAARMAQAGAAIYSASKAAAEVLTQSYARELGPRGIRVNAISPGLIVTEGTRASGLIGSDMAKSRIAATPLRRAGLPEDIADVAVFLASASARFVTGQVLAVSGGN